MLCLRAKLIDNFVKDYLAKNNESVAWHLGCGLDSRYDRIKDDNVDWYDVDFKDVIDIHRQKTGAVIHWGIDNLKNSLNG